MTPRKYVLIVDSRGECSRGKQALDGQGYEFDRVSNLAGALDAASELEKLSLVIVDSDSHRHGRERFSSLLRSLQPRLPLLWVGDAVPAPRSSVRRPIIWHSDSAALKRQVATLLRDEFYESGLTEDILGAAIRVLRDFGLEAECSGPYIKSSVSALRDLNALIAFTGERLSGHVLLSSAAASARALHENALPGEPEPGQDELEDLLGEVANRVVGAIKRVFETRSRSFKLKATAFLRGKRVRYRHKAASPSLALDFSHDTGALSLEFCPEHVAEGSLEKDPEAEFVESGEIHFL